MEVISSLDEKKETGNVEITVISEWEHASKEKKVCDEYLYASLINEEGGTEDEIFPLPVESEMSFCMRVDKPVLWNAEEVRSYDLILKVGKEDVVKEQESVKVAFFKWEILDGVTCLNEKAVVFRAVKWPQGLLDTEQREEFLVNLKRQYKNAILVKNGKCDPQLEQLCIRYGVYLVEEGVHIESGALLAKLDHAQEEEIQIENPDFHLRVVQNGVLIENQCIFANASNYKLCYQVRKQELCISSGEMSADVPPGSSRFIEIPFGELSEPGSYTYSAALCLKRDCPWAEKGYIIAEAKTEVSNLYERADVSGNVV